MEFEKYSKHRFEELGLGTPAARKLADELQEDVTKGMHEAVLAAFQKVVNGLNARGHRLTPYDEIEAGQMSYRDEPGGEACYLRLSCDVVISAGYGHTTSAADADNLGEEEWQKIIGGRG
jgi:hypothetical protein